MFPIRVKADLHDEFVGYADPEGIGENMSTPETLASDPGTDLSLLAQLAQDHPQLQKQIAENPSAYPDLLTWIATYGTPEGADAASRRIQAEAEESAETTVEFGFTDNQSSQVIAEEDYTTVSKGWVEAPTEQMEATLLRPRQAPPTQAPMSPTVPGLTPPTLAPMSTPVPGRMSPPGMMPPPLLQPQPALGSEPKKSATTVVLLGILLGVLVALIVGAAIWFFVLRDSSTSEGESQTMAEADSAEAATAKALAEKEEAEAARLEAEQALAQMQAEAEAAEREEKASVADNQVRYPAPATAVTAPWFISPSGNIACELDAIGAKCTIYQAEFGLSAPGCTSPPYTIIADGDSARWDCSVWPVPNDANGPVLEYSTSSTAANSACLSTYRGMTCWDTVSGYSFAIAREGFMLSSGGLIPETEFPWR